MSVCRAPRGVLSSFCYFVKLGSKPGPFVKNNFWHRNLQLFSIKIHGIPPFPGKCGYVALTPIFESTSQKDPWQPQEIGWQKHLEILNLNFFPETSMLAPIQTTGFPRLTFSRTTAAWLWEKTVGCFLAVFFVSIRGPGTCSSGERTVTSRMGCLGIVQGDFSQKKRGLPPKKGKLIYTYTPWKTFPRGYVYIHLHFMCELEKHC